MTTLIAKDRVTGHNPATALYTYYGDAYFDKDPEVKALMKVF